MGRSATPNSRASLGTVVGVISVPDTSSPPTTPPTSRKVGRPADSDSADTRLRIVECARERFAAEGFEGTTNREIATRAGISSAALYHYFPSKADMYVAVCDSMSTMFTRVFADIAAEHRDFEHRVAALFNEVGRLGAEAPSMIGFITGISTVVRRHPEVSGGTDAFFVQFRSLIADLISTADDHDRVLRGTTPQAFTDLLVAVLGGLGRLSVRGDQARHVAAAGAFLSLLRGGAPE